MATRVATSQPPTAARDHARRRWIQAWATTLSVLCGLLFVTVTALTLTLWATDPGYTETGPVVDLAFFTLGGILVTVGIATQVRAPRVAGLQQAVVALLALAGAGAAGGRVEPLVGALLLLAAVSPLAVWHPHRGRLLAAGAGPSRPMTVLAIAAAIPALVYAAGMLERARAAGPSCFLGQCAQGDRYAETAAVAIAVVLVALLAALHTDGWRLPAGCAGAAAIVLGGASVAFPGEAGALSTWWALAGIGWGTALIALARLSDGRTRHRGDEVTQQGR
jgi:hypothetical protein